MGQFTSGWWLESSHFLQAGQVLTKQGLALLVLNPPVDFQTNLTWSTLRFAARCSVNREPVLLNGVLVQLGGVHVFPYMAKDVPAVPVVAVACARVSVYADMWDGSWEDFAAHPVKLVLAKLHPLHTCRTADCQCTGWHPSSDQPQDAVLDVFRRQFYNDAGRPVKWDKASHFSVLIRYIKSIELRLLGLSGQAGIFLEPKSEDAQQPNGEFQVVWLPQLDFSGVVRKAKCEVACLGIARSGKRFGIRVSVQDFARVFQATKPDAVYLAPGTRLQFACGPWPFGSDRKCIARILKSHGWEARPLQPSQHVTGGLMWTIQALVDPPSNVLHMQHGQVVISRMDAKEVPSQGTQPVVGQAKTVALCCQPEAGVDPWLVQDPWSKPVQPALPASMPPATQVLQEMEQRLEQSLMSKLPAHDKMEVDDYDQRLQTLETQLLHLATRQAGLESTVHEHHQQNTAQVQSLQQQMKVQMDLQTQQMSSMLTDQMARIETILSKKPRTE